jgi:uncharacterized membrane protein
MAARPPNEQMNASTALRVRSAGAALALSTAALAAACRSKDSLPPDADPLGPPSADLPYLPPPPAFHAGQLPYYPQVPGVAAGLPYYGPCPAQFFEGVGAFGIALSSSARDVSAAGDRVVGSGDYAVPTTHPHMEQAFGWTRICEHRPFWLCDPPRWMGGAGLVGLGFPTSAARRESGASGIAPDGRAAAGYSNEGTSSVPRPVLWQQPACNRPLVLDLLPEHVMGRAFDVSDRTAMGGKHVRVVVGYSSTAENHAHRTPGATPVVWTNADPTALALRVPSVFPVESGEARTLAADASVVVGTLYDFAGGRSAACAWVLDTVANDYRPVLLADLPGGADSCAAGGVSGDGSIVVGWGTAASGKQPSYWKRTLGPAVFEPAQPLPMQVLGSSEIGAEGEALAADHVGAVLGGALVLDGEYTAVRWPLSASGPGAPETVLDRLLGASIAVPPGWHLFYVARLSADGRTLVGEGLDPAGNVAGWVAAGP